MASGDVATVCGTGGTCTDDGLEDNDSLATATAAMPMHADLQICSGDSDYFRIDGAFRDLVTVRVDGFVSADGDIDLRLLSSTGTILSTSAGVTDSEVATACIGDTGRVYAQVLGFGTDENAYDVSIARMPMACCSDDTFEPDDTRATARRITGSAFDGTICPPDSDFVAVTVTGASLLHVEILFDEMIGDLDLELQRSDGTLIDSSTGITGSEVIDVMVPSAGTYYVRVYGFMMAANTYLGEVTATPVTTCTDTITCAIGQVCDGGTCASDACTSTASCPPMHLCPTYGPASAARHCGDACTVNADCRSAEACKWFPEGRACGVRGAGANGAACASATECGGQRACLPWSGGYCARAACRTNSDCETGTYCVDVSGTRACVIECESDPMRCRTAESYACRSVTDAAGTPRRACVP
jgi:hypothetical protein